MDDNETFLVAIQDTRRDDGIRPLSAGAGCSTLEGLAPAQVAAPRNLSLNAVPLAESRVLKQLRQEAEEPID